MSRGGRERCLGMFAAPYPRAWFPVRPGKSWKGRGAHIAKYGPLFAPLGAFHRRPVTVGRLAAQPLWSFCCWSPRQVFTLHRRRHAGVRRHLTKTSSACPAAPVCRVSGSTAAICIPAKLAYCFTTLTVCLFLSAWPEGHPSSPLAWVIKKARSWIKTCFATLLRQTAFRQASPSGTKAETLSHSFLIITYVRSCSTISAG
ncbi:MAG: hypothetical protein CM15mP115_15630 [Alphaproteobacteria bacterium]|nr:MAG: hypothetical protein CM15mP115_15630 [Alphaproteobacteria bacterium]